MSSLVPRAASEQLKELVDDFRVVIVNGPRQGGKTTLLELYRDTYGGTYRSLDDPDQLRAAREDPVTYAWSETLPLMIDEVQRGGDDLVLAVKRQVDRDKQRPGQFVLSGSTRFLTVPTLSESLAGRAVFLDLWQLSMGERTSGGCGSLRAVFQDPMSLVGARSPWTRDGYIDLVCTGNYPEAIRLRAPASRRRWFTSYVRTIVERDIEEFAAVEHADVIPKLLALVAARSGSPFVASDVARSLQVNYQTVQTYLSYVAMVFLVAEVPAWSTNLTSRLTKASKVFLTDSGLAASLLRVGPEGLREPGARSLGGLVETFVFAELVKLRSLTGDAFEIYHYRDRDQREIDFILEAPDGRIVAVEVKGTATPSPDHARHLRWLRDKLGERFVAGVVLHVGEHSLSYGNRIIAAPISTLWDHRSLG